MSSNFKHHSLIQLIRNYKTQTNKWLSKTIIKFYQLNAHLRPFEPITWTQLIQIHP